MNNTGHVIQVIGPVVDVEFLPEQLPAIYNAVLIEGEDVADTVRQVVFLMRVGHPDIDIDVTHTAESRYLADKIVYRSTIGDVTERWLYAPLIRAVESAAGLMRRAHTGSVP